MGEAFWQAPYYLLRRHAGVFQAPPDARRRGTAVGPRVHKVVSVAARRAAQVLREDRGAAPPRVLEALHDLTTKASSILVISLQRGTSRTHGTTKQ
jgi:hypothetical protein